MNTYAWIIDTAVSNINNVINGMMDGIVLLIDDSMKFLRRSIIRCPAVMLAVNRIDNVIGRIIFLIISIKNMKFIKWVGVLRGIVWINIFFVLINQPIIMMDVHMVRASVNEILMCAVDVKINGNRAIMLDIKMNVKIVLIKGIDPFSGLLINMFISLLIMFNIGCFLL